MTKAQRIRPYLLAAAVLAVMLTITLLLYKREQEVAQHEIQATLEFNLRETASRIGQNLTAYEQMLRGVRGFVTGAHRPDYAEFKAYVNTLELGADFAGIEGVGMAQYVPASGIKAHVDAVHSAGRADYRVFPFGARDAYAPIVQSEPEVGWNLQIRGYDLLADVVARQAMMRAARSGSFSMGQSAMFKDGSTQHGQGVYVVYLPVYRVGVPLQTEEDRLAALTGWVFASLEIRALMASLYGTQRNEVQVSLYSTVEREAQDLLYQFGTPSDDADGLEATEYVSAGGVNWALSVKPGTSFAQSAGRDRSTVMLWSGLVFSTLLSLMCLQILTAKNYALKLARDMTGELRKSVELNRHLAQHDPLTGLPNRALLMDRVSQALHRARRDSGQLAILFIDLDKFKPINDVFGHDAGDAVLKAVAQRLSASIRESDTVARIGGDEFVVLLGNVDSPESVQSVLAKMLDALHIPVDWNGNALAVYASVGVAIYPADGADETQLFRVADEAMYRDKALRRAVASTAPG